MGKMDFLFKMKTVTENAEVEVNKLKLNNTEI